MYVIKTTRSSPLEDEKFVSKIECTNKEDAKKVLELMINTKKAKYDEYEARYTYLIDDDSLHVYYMYLEQLDLRIHDGWDSIDGS